MEGFEAKEERRLQTIYDLLFGHHIYVDGSYKEGQVGYGYIVLEDGEKIHEDRGLVTGKIDSSSNQVGGEIMAVQKALLWCQERGVQSVTIHCDLEAMIYWAKGIYKTNIPLTKNFKAFLDTCAIEITWHKVEAHSGEPFNEEVDRLAKEGASLGRETEGIDREDERDVNQMGRLSLDTLEEVAHQFAQALRERGYTPEERGLFNKQCAKILLHHEGRRLGHFNLYATKKKGLVPRYHEILKEEDREDLAKYWNIFVAEGDLYL